MAAMKPSAGLRRVLLAIALILYTVLFAEAFVRIVDPQPVMPRYVTGTPWGVRGNIPKARYWHHTPEVTVEYRINSQGCARIGIIRSRSPPGMCRIALLGDSFFIGYELDLKDTFAVQLENALRRRGFNAEVLNFAVSGFGQAEMLITYDRYAKKFDPDVVVFQWHSSDPDDNVRSGLYRLIGKHLERARPQYLPGVKIQDSLMKSNLYRFIADNSQLYSAIRTQVALEAKILLVRLRRAKVREENAEQASITGTPRAKRAMALSAALLEEAEREATQDHRDFLVVDIPRAVGRTEFSSTIEDLRAVIRPGMKIVSPVQAFAAVARPDRKLFYEKGQGHFTPSGVRVLTKEVVKQLAASPSLTACKQHSGR